MAIFAAKNIAPGDELFYDYRCAAVALHALRAVVCVMQACVCVALHARGLWCVLCMCLLSWMSLFACARVQIQALLNLVAWRFSS